MVLTGDGEQRTAIYCRGEGHALWWTDVAYANSDRLDPTVWSTSSPGSPYPDEPLLLPVACPLDGSGLLKAGLLASGQSSVRWL